MCNLTLRNCNAITKDGLMKNVTVDIKYGLISDILSHDTRSIKSNEIDLKGSFLMPGIIDTHSDYFEKEIAPRRKASIPTSQALNELDKKLSVQGITTIYHSPSMYEEVGDNWIRNNNTVVKIIKDIKKFKDKPNLINHKVHLRLEYNNLKAVNSVKKLLIENMIDQLSIMDHTPGQGQVSDINNLQKLMAQVNNVSLEESLEMINILKEKPKISDKDLKSIAELATVQKIPLVSHDDDSIEKIQKMKELNFNLSEFPINKETAIEAKRRGMYIAMGAPNLILERSHMNNLSALEAVNEGLVDILCSDYLPSSLFMAINKLWRIGWSLDKAVNLVTYNPACAMRISKVVGTIDLGKIADLVVFKENKGVFYFEKAIVKGRVKSSLNFNV